MDRHRGARLALDPLGVALAQLDPLLDAPADRQIAVDRIVRRGLVGQRVRPDPAPHHLRQDLRRIAEQADRDRLVGGADHLQRLVDAGRALVEIARLQPLRDPALLAFDRDAMRPGHHRRERLRAAHAAEARGQDPFALEVAAMMLAAHLDEGLVSALNDALGADVDPRAGRHLAVHHQPLAIELVEMVPGRPVRHEVGIGDQDARRVLVGREDADRLARLDEQGLVLAEPLQASKRSRHSFPSRAPPGRCRHRRPAPPAPRRLRGSRLFISIRIAASVVQLRQLSSVPVGAAIWRLLSRLVHTYPLVRGVEGRWNVIRPRLARDERARRPPAKIRRSGPGRPIQ